MFFNSQNNTDMHIYTLKGIVVVEIGRPAHSGSKKKKKKAISQQVMADKVQSIWPNSPKFSSSSELMWLGGQQHNAGISYRKDCNCRYLFDLSKSHRWSCVLAFTLFCNTWVNVVNCYCDCFVAEGENMSEVLTQRLHACVRMLVCMSVYVSVSVCVCVCVYK